MASCALKWQHACCTLVPSPATSLRSWSKAASRGFSFMCSTGGMHAVPLGMALPCAGLYTQLAMHPLQPVQSGPPCWSSVLAAAVYRVLVLQPNGRPAFPGPERRLILVHKHCLPLTLWQAWLRVQAASQPPSLRSRARAYAQRGSCPTAGTALGGAGGGPPLSGHSSPAQIAAPLQLPAAVAQTGTAQTLHWHHQFPAAGSTTAVSGWLGLPTGSSIGRASGKPHGDSGYIAPQEDL